MVGWSSAFIIILFCMCFEYDNFGGIYHCWLQLDTRLMYGIYVPIIVLVIVTFAFLSAVVDAALNNVRYYTFVVLIALL